MLLSLEDILLKRFSIEVGRLIIISPLFKIDPATDIKQIHEMIAPDSDLTSLYMQFAELCNSDFNKAGSISEVIGILIRSERGLEEYRELITLLARIYACTPHSADVERCISANNLLKTSLRSNFSLNTEYRYLYLQFNLLALEKWDPRPAIQYWLQVNPVLVFEERTPPERYFDFQKSRHFAEIFLRHFFGCFRYK